MKIAVALLTCDRYDYTERTVESLLRHHDADSLMLFHADDASTDDRIIPCVQSKGFETLVQNNERIGCSPTTEKLITAVAERVEPGTLVLYLQSDFTCGRPLPEPLVRSLLARSDVGFVQLSYRRPRSSYFRRMQWRYPNGELWSFGELPQDSFVVAKQGTGLGYHPSIAPIENWVRATRGVVAEKGFVRNTKRMKLRACRLTEPVFRHIGRKSTPNGKFGKARKDRRARVGRFRYTRKRARSSRNAMQVGATLCKRLTEVLRPGMKTLECGSGLSTWLFLAMGCEHTALEHESKYAPPLPQVKVCELTGSPLWYDWTPEGPYDVVLIDGPPGKIGRSGILSRLPEIAHSGTVFICDDTNRRRDAMLARRIAKRLRRTKENVGPQCKQDFGKQFTILHPRHAT